MSFRLLPPALDDLEELEEWVEENFGPAVAANAHNKLIEDFQRLVKFPRLGRLRPDITEESLRFFRSGHYYVVYRPGSPLLIHRIVHTARELRQIFKG
jgi:plasmid stabilization system protein ParE